MTERTGQTCETVRELAPDVALGLLTGEERADALAHLERCDRCRAEVASLAVAADEVLLAGPRVAPPAGFADRVVAALAEERSGADRSAGGGLPAASGVDRPAARAGGASPSRLPRPEDRRRGWPRRVALATAAAVVVVAGLVAVVRTDGGPEPEVAVAEMVSGRGRHVGTATATSDGGGSATVTLAVPEWDALLDRWGGAPAGSYWLVVEQRDGTRTMRALAPEVEDWSMEVRAPVEAVAAVSMVDQDGRVWCTGAFTPT